MSSFSLDSDKQDITSKFFNADSFSIFTSIGLHLLLLGGLVPSLWKISSDGKTQDPQRTVGVIELSPIEQSRLPNLSPTPEVPSVPSIPNIPSLNNSSIPDLYSLNPSPSLPSLPSVPSLPPLPPLSSLPSSPPAVDIYSPPIPSVRIPSTQSYYPPAPPYNLPAPPSNPNIEPAKPRSITKPPFDPFKETLDLENLRRAPITASQAEQLRNQQQREKPSETALVPQTKPVQNLPNQAAIIAERRRRLLNDVLEGSASLQPESTNTTEEEARRNYITWLNKVKVAQPEAVAVGGIYPKTACAKKIEGSSVYGVTVNPQGIITGTPYLIRSAGYPIFNEKAFQVVRSLGFQNTSGQVKSYRVTVNYKYDPSVCPTYTQPLPQNPVETRANPPQAPILETPKPSVPTQPQNQPPAPATVPQEPANPQPDNVRVDPPVTPKPENLIPQSQEDNLINTPTGNPKPENLVPQTPASTQPAPPVIQQTPTVEPLNPPTTKKPETPTPQPVVEPPTQKPDVNPPSPPTSKKPEPPLSESRKPE